MMLFTLYTINNGDADIEFRDMNVEQAMNQGDHVKRMVNLLIDDSLAMSVEIDYGDGSGHLLKCKEA